MFNAAFSARRSKRSKSYSNSLAAALQDLTLRGTWQYRLRFPGRSPEWLSRKVRRKLSQTLKVFVGYRLRLARKWA
jgi:hypothetical protein